MGPRKHALVIEEEHLLIRDGCFGVKRLEVCQFGARVYLLLIKQADCFHWRASRPNLALPSGRVYGGRASVVDEDEPLEGLASGRGRTCPRGGRHLHALGAEVEENGGNMGKEGQGGAVSIDDEVERISLALDGCVDWEVASAVSKRADSSTHHVYPPTEATQCSFQTPNPYIQSCPWPSPDKAYSTHSRSKATSLGSGSPSRRRLSATLLVDPSALPSCFSSPPLPKASLPMFFLRLGVMASGRGRSGGNKRHNSLERRALR